MKLADVPHMIRDTSRHNTYVIYAYRKLDRDELQRLLGAFVSGKKRLGKNRRYEIFTNVGIRDPIDDGGWR